MLSTVAINSSEGGIAKSGAVVSASIDQSKISAPVSIDQTGAASNGGGDTELNNIIEEDSDDNIMAGVDTSLDSLNMSRDYYDDERQNAYSAAALEGLGSDGISFHPASVDTASTSLSHIPATEVSNLLPNSDNPSGSSSIASSYNQVNGQVISHVQDKYSSLDSQNSALMGDFLAAAMAAAASSAESATSNGSRLAGTKPPQAATPEALVASETPVYTGMGILRRFFPTFTSAKKAVLERQLQQEQVALNTPNESAPNFGAGHDPEYAISIEDKQHRYTDSTFSLPMVYSDDTADEPVNGEGHKSTLGAPPVSQGSLTNRRGGNNNPFGFVPASDISDIEEEDEDGSVPNLNLYNSRRPHVMHAHSYEDDNGEHDNLDHGDEDENFKVYWQRWLMLLYMSLLNLLSDWTCYSVAPISVLTSEAFGSVQPTALVTAFLAANAISTALEPGILSRLGLRGTIVLGALLMLLGSLTKSGVPFFHPIQPGASNQAWKIYLGFFIVGLSQPLYQCTPALLSNSWFPEKERTMATGVALNSNQLGIGFAFVFGTLLVSTADDIPAYFCLMTCVSFLLLVGTLFQFDDAPPTPPSGSAKIIRGSYSIPVPKFFRSRRGSSLNKGNKEKESPNQNNFNARQEDEPDSLRKTSPHGIPRQRVIPPSNSNTNEGSVREMMGRNQHLTGDNDVAWDDGDDREMLPPNSNQPQPRAPPSHPHTHNYPPHNQPLFYPPHMMSHPEPWAVGGPYQGAPPFHPGMYPIYGPGGMHWGGPPGPPGQSPQNAPMVPYPYQMPPYSYQGSPYLGHTMNQMLPPPPYSYQDEAYEDQLLDGIDYDFDDPVVQEYLSRYLPPVYSFDEGAEPIEIISPHHVTINIRDDQILLSAKACFSRPGFTHSCIAFVVSAIVINTLSTDMDYLVRLGGAGREYVGIVGGLFQLLIMLSSLVIGTYTDKTRTYYTVVIVMLVLGAFALAQCGVRLDQEKGSELRMTLLLVAVLVGPLQPVATELGVEVAYPLSENTVLVIQQFFANLLSAVFIQFFDMARNIGTNQINEQTGTKRPEFTFSFYLLIVLHACGTVVFATFNGRYLRYEAEESKKLIKRNKAKQRRGEDDFYLSSNEAFPPPSMMGERQPLLSHNQVL